MRIFQKSLCYSCLISSTVREHSLYDLNCLKLIENCYCQKIIYVGKWSVYMGLSFIMLSFIALCRNFISFLQIESLWQFCLKQIYWHHFSKAFTLLSLCHILIILKHFSLLLHGDQQSVMLRCYCCNCLWGSQKTALIDGKLNICMCSSCSAY